MDYYSLSGGETQALCTLFSGKDMIDNCQQSCGHKDLFAFSPRWGENKCVAAIQLAASNSPLDCYI